MFLLYFYSKGVDHITSEVNLKMINDYCFLCTYWLTSYGWWLYAYSDKSILVENAPWLNVMWPCDMYLKSGTGALITRMSYII